MFHNFTRSEKRAVSGLGLIFALRMFGIFMILPVFANYATQFTGSTEFTIGLAIGIYGLTQALFQIPFGLYSDHIGRIPLIIAGLLIFALGAILAATATSIYMVILGRALQGIGAVSSVIMALLSDLTREQNRTKVMALIGMSFGVTMALSLVLGPIISHYLGLTGIFWIMACCAFIGIFITLYWVPKPERIQLNRDTSIIRGSFSKVLHDRQLLKLNFSIFCLHLILMVIFVGLPPLLVQEGLAKEQHWIMYLSMMLISFVCLMPVVLIAEKHKKMKSVFIGCIVLIVLSLLLIGVFSSHLGFILLGAQGFFLAFNVIEALLPSWLSKDAPAGYRGTAMGVYSTGQFLGVSVGGIAAGWLNSHYSLNVVFICSAVLALIWCFISITMREPSYVSSFRFELPESNDHYAALTQQMKNTEGIIEIELIADERAVYLKFDRNKIDRQHIYDLIHQT